MQRLSLHFLKEDAPAASVVLTKTGAFHPETGDISAEALPESPGERYRTVFSSARARFDKIAARVERIESPSVREPRVVELGELERLNERLGAIWREVSDLEEAQRLLEERRRSVRSLAESLEKFSKLDVDLGLLHRRGRFLDLHVGTIPRHSRSQLKAAAALAGHFAGSFHTTEDLDYVVVAGPADSEREIRELLQAADFRSIAIPAEFKDHPEKIDHELAEQGVELEEEYAGKLSEMRAMGERYREELAQAAETLRLAAAYNQMAANLRGRGGLALVEGWVPRRDVHHVKRAIDNELAHPCVMSARDPRPDERAQVPSVLRHPRWLRPFADLVRNYGVPRYREIDPTWLFSITFIAMFGMMFGDVGQGAVIALIGLALRNRYPAVVPFMVAAGIASMAFGFVYGSVFGYEHLLQPLWIAPLSDPMAMLEVALLWGILFIVAVNVLTVYNLLNEQRRLEALFGPRGIAGLLLYLGGVWLVYQWLARDAVSVGTLLPALLGLAAVLGYKWHTVGGAPGERVLVAFIEAFESVIAYLANTLSFLRVAAFSLNHVALAIAVFTLADTLGATGRGLTLVIGNIFIIALEGAIVAIQVLRLEYYEGFSGFFRGDGREFQPMKLGANAGT